MGPKGSLIFKTSRYTILDPFGPLWYVEKPAMFGHFCLFYWCDTLYIVQLNSPASRQCTYTILSLEESDKIWMHCMFNIWPKLKFKHSPWNCFVQNILNLSHTTRLWSKEQIHSVGATIANLKKMNVGWCKKIKTEAKFSNRAKVLFKGMQGARAVVLCTGGRQKIFLTPLEMRRDYTDLKIVIQISRLLFKYFNIVHYQNLTRPYCPSHIGWSPS